MKAEKRTCPHCDSPLIEEERPYVLHGILLGRFPVLVCSVCRRVYHPGATAIAIEKAAREKGIWGLAAEREIPTVELVPVDREPSVATVADENSLLLIEEWTEWTKLRDSRPSGTTKGPKTGSRSRSTRSRLTDSNQVSTEDLE